MSRPLRFIIVFFLIVPAITRSTVLTARDTFATAQGDRERFVGAWRLAWLEEPGADGKVHRADCTGQFVFTSDGYASVQVMYRNPGGGAAGPVQYRAGRIRSLVWPIRHRRTRAGLDVPRRRGHGSQSGW